MGMSFHWGYEVEQECSIYLLGNQLIAAILQAACSFEWWFCAGLFWERDLGSFPSEG